MYPPYRLKQQCKPPRHVLMWSHLTSRHATLEQTQQLLATWGDSWAMQLTNTQPSTSSDSETNPPKGQTRQAQGDRVPAATRQADPAHRPRTHYTTAAAEKGKGEATPKPRPPQPPADDDTPSPKQQGEDQPAGPSHWYMREGETMEDLAQAFGSTPVPLVGSW